MVLCTSAVKILEPRPLIFENLNSSPIDKAMNPNATPDTELIGTAYSYYNILISTYCPILLPQI